MSTTDARTLAQIDAELAERREALAQVRGRETEIYSRIVGYYRSLRNWNHGKKAEFVERLTYAAEESRGVSTPGVAAELQLFTREQCPGCRVAKQLLTGLPMVSSQVVEVDIDTRSGAEHAEREMVMVTPKLIVRGPDGRELWRSSDPRDMQTRLAEAVSESEAAGASA